MMVLLVAVEEARGGWVGRWEVGSGRREERRVGGGVRSGKGGGAKKRGRVDGGLVYVMGFGGLGLCDGVWGIGSV